MLDCYGNTRMDKEKNPCRMGKKPSFDAKNK